MDVWRITVAVLRRWYVFLPLLVLTGFGALRVGDGVHPEYEVTATAVLVPGTEVSDVEGPYGNRNDTTQVLTIVLDGPASREAVAEQGLTPDYEVSTRDRTSIINLTVLSDSSPVSLGTAEAVLELARQELKERQDAAGVPSAAQVGLQVLQAPSVTDVVAEGRTRNMAIVGLVGAALSLVVALLFDDLVTLLKRGLQRRGERRVTKPGTRSGGAKQSAKDAADAVENDSDVEIEAHDSPRTVVPEDATPRTRIPKDLANRP